MQVLARVRQTIRDHDLIRTDTRVVAAVSGGSDSVALAHVLRDLDAAGALRLAGVVHVNHGLRVEADGDERFARAVADAVDRPYVTERADVAARARRERRSVEDAGRAARHEAFERARVHFGADVVAIGHTRDDQAETFLLRLLRGAGMRGLAGMHPRNGTIVRPLLDCRRADLRAWLGGRGIAFVEDLSNQDVTIPRNRVRAELVPMLASRFNPAIVEVLAREAGLARDAWQILEQAADETAARIVKESDGTRIVDLEELGALPRPLRRIALWRTLELARPVGAKPVGFDHVDAALRLIEADGDGALDVPGQRWERIGVRLVLKPVAVDGAAAQAANFFEYRLSIPGEVDVAEAACIVSAEPLPEGGASAADPRARVGRGSVAVVSAELCRGRLSVRNRRPGDRFRPVGLGGRKKLQDVFVDHKVVRANRDRVPIVVDERGRIVWVAGFGIDEAFRVTDAAQAVLLLRLTPVGGPS